MLPSQFGGSLDGAKWTALSVRNPEAQFTGDLAGVPQNNIILTTNGNPSIVSFNNIGDAQAQLQPPNQGVAWFALLKSIGSANGTSILENTSSRLVIGTSLYASYTGVLGFGSDAVANQLPLSTAGIVSAAVIGSAASALRADPDGGVQSEHRRLRPRHADRVDSARSDWFPSPALRCCSAPVCSDSCASAAAAPDRSRFATHETTQERESHLCVSLHSSRPPSRLPRQRFSGTPARRWRLPNASLSPDTDAFRTGGCTGCFITQMNSVTAQFQEITRVFRGCYRRRNDPERRQRLR